VGRVQVAERGAEGAGGVVGPRSSGRRCGGPGAGGG
jgi:hypothetical protein